MVLKILNYLLDEDKAIVTNIPGTTRDIVEGTITLNGVALNFIDTAGIRETDDVVEKIGVDKSKSVAKNADIIIYVLNNNEEISPEELETMGKIEAEKTIIFVNKSDLEQKINLGNISREIILGNTVSDNGLDNLLVAIKNKLNLDSIVNKDMSYLSNIREITLVNKASVALNSAKKSLEEELPIDVIEIDLKRAWEYLGEIIGDAYEDELVDNIFSNFCLGK